MKILCKQGEMLLKSRPVRREFSRRLRRNIDDAFQSIAHGQDASVPWRFSRSQANLIVECELNGAREVLQRVFGLVSVAEVVSAGLVSLDQAVQFGKTYFESMTPGKRFAVRCRRVGHHDFTSLDVERTLGAELAPGAIVDLSHPDLTCHINITDDAIRVYSETHACAGGLPIGTQGRALCLISGGIDSPVAAWWAMKRGLEVDYLFCNLGSAEQNWGPLSTARHLADNWSFGYNPRFYILDFTELLDAFQNLDHRYRNILLKRYFYRAADRLADSVKADAIVTGEALGQVSSQTLSNLRTITQTTNKVILRPLIAQDKTEIIAKARQIGTLEISEKVPEYCNVAVRKPRTRSTVDTLVRMEEDIPDSILDRAFQQIQKLDLKSISGPLKSLELQTALPSESACFIWVTGPSDVQSPPGDADLVIDQTQIRRNLKKLDKSRKIIVGCEKGILAHDAVAYLIEKNYNAFVYRKDQAKDENRI